MKFILSNDKQKSVTVTKRKIYAIDRFLVCTDDIERTKKLLGSRYANNATYMEFIVPCKFFERSYGIKFLVENLSMNGIFAQLRPGENFFRWTSLKEKEYIEAIWMKKYA